MTSTVAVTDTEPGTAALNKSPIQTNGGAASATGSNASSLPFLPVCEIGISNEPGKGN